MLHLPSPPLSSQSWGWPWSPQTLWPWSPAELPALHQQTPSPSSDWVSSSCLSSQRSFETDPVSFFQHRFFFKTNKKNPSSGLIYWTFYCPYASYKIVLKILGWLFANNTYLLVIFCHLKSNIIALLINHVNLLM